MEVRILGPTEVVLDGEPVRLPTGRSRSLLGLLALHPGEVISADRLIDELWGESPPPTVDTALQGLVYKLRKRLEPNRVKGESPRFLLTRSPGYLLSVAPAQVDANRFRRMVAEAAEAQPGKAASLLRRALAMWRGPALADFSYESFAQVEIAELEELRLTTLEKRIEADLALGRHREVIGDLERLVSEHPLREGLRELLMLALYRSNRQAEALQMYSDLRSTLVDQLGLDPGPSLQRLEDMILRQDPALDLDLVSPSDPEIDKERWIQEERRIVTVLSIDVSASTHSGDIPDAEVSRRVLEEFFRRAATVVTGHGGSVEETIGDTIVAIFGLPAAREDDALRAVRAAVDLRHLLAAVNHELGESGSFRLSVRTGIETGEVVVGETSGGLSGTPVRGATQLRHAAGTGEIVIGKATRLLVGRSVLSESREVDIGDGSPRTVWRVLDLIQGAPAFPLTLEAPLVDREAELNELRAAYERAADAPHRVTLLGEPGVGKSRLARELASVIGSDAWVLTGHCPAYGEGNTFRPLLEIVQGATGRLERSALVELLSGEEDAEQIADGVMAAMGSAGSTGPPPLATFPLARRFFEVLAARRPVVVIVEDLHWAKPTFLELVDYLTESSHERLLLLCVARPELLEEHPDWIEGDRSQSLVLDPLGPEESRTLATKRLGGRMVPAEVLTRVLDSAQGNPLFVEQLIATIGEEGDFSIPTTVRALLAARIDRLGPAERDLIRVASVLGYRFPEAALNSLLPEPARPHVPRHIRTLQRKNLMLQATESARGDELGFRHILIQQAAYHSMTMHTRAELHEQAAEWLEAAASRNVQELEEIVGHHLERAYEYRQELGEVGEHPCELATRAGEKLASAGFRAFGRLDAAGAENLLGRARKLLPAGHSRQWEVSFRLSEAYETMGRHGAADTLLSEMLATEPGTSDHRVVLELERARVRFATGPDPVTLDEIVDLAESALAQYEAAGDEARMAQALFMLGEVERRRGQVSEMEEVVRRGMAHADRSDSSREQLGARRLLATALELGPTPVHRCIEECEELAIWQENGNPAVLPILAHLHAEIGDFDRSREMIARARRVLRERARARRPRMLLRKRHAEVETLAGDLDSAEHQLRRALELGLEMETRDEASEIAALLARVLFQKEAFDEAATMAELSREQAPAESVAPQVRWRSARGLTLAAHGEFEQSLGLARRAVGQVPVDMLNLRADTSLDLARILRAGGYRDEARDAVNETIDIYERKGNLVAASRARAEWTAASKAR